MAILTALKRRQKKQANCESNLRCLQNPKFQEWLHVALMYNLPINFPACDIQDIKYWSMLKTTILDINNEALINREQKFNTGIMSKIER